MLVLIYTHFQNILLCVVFDLLFNYWTTESWSWISVWGVWLYAYIVHVENDTLVIYKGIELE